MAGKEAADDGQAARAPHGHSPEQWVRLGRISGVYGVHGWVKVFSDTSPPSNILQYRQWYLQRDGRWEQHGLADGRSHGKGIVARLAGCDDRDRAALLIGADIAVRRDQLPSVEEGEYYWADLEGLKVQTLDGVDLGRIDYLFQTGANDVMVVKGERQRLLPFIDTVVRDVDLRAGVMVVDWDPGF